MSNNIAQPEKLDSMRNFDDWRALYIDAGDRMALDEVANYTKWMDLLAEDEWQISFVKSAKSWLLSTLNQYQDAIDLYDDIVKTNSASLE